MTFGLEGIGIQLRRSFFVFAALIVVVACGVVNAFADGDGSFRWAYAMERTSMHPSVESSPVIGSDGTVYVGAAFATTPESGALVAITPVGDTGATEKWRFPMPDRVEASPTIGPDGTVYIGCFDGKLYAINGSTGTAKWASPYDTNTQSSDPTYIHSTAALSRDGTTLYVGVGTFGLSAASSRGALYAISTSGQLLWTHWFNDVVEGSPGIGPDGTIYVGSWDRNLYAVNPDGTLKWSHALDGEIWGSAAIGGDGTIYIGSISNEFVALTPDNQVKWQINFTATGSAALGADGTVYVGNWSDSNLYALDPNTGVAKWMAPGQPAAGSTPLVRSDGSIIFGGEDAVLRAYNRTDGSVLWSYSIPTGGRLYSCPAVAPTSDHGIYIGSADGKLYAFRGNGSGISLYSTWPMFQHDVLHSGCAPQPVSGGQLVNMAARGQAGPGLNLIAGFVVRGSGLKPLLIRAVGPTLNILHVDNPMPDPALTVHITSTFAPYVNNDWGDNENAADIASTGAAVGAFPLPTGSKDAAVLAQAIAGIQGPVTTYTTTVESADGGTGVALVETYDADLNSSVHLVNLSARGHVGSGENVLIPSIVIKGGRLRVLVRAVGPGLVQLGVSDVIAQPTLAVYSGQQVIASNTGWTTGGIGGDLAGAASLVGAFALPNGSADSAMILSLDPGPYTFQVSGANGGTGEALVEVYALPY